MELFLCYIIWTHRVCELLVVQVWLEQAKAREGKQFIGQHINRWVKE